MKKLLDAQTEDGSSEVFLYSGGPGMFAVVGTLGGATVSLEYRSPSFDADEWITIKSITTSEGTQNFEIPPGQVRATVASADVYTSVDAFVSGTSVT